MSSFTAFALNLYNKKKITRWLEDMNFILWFKQYFTHSLATHIRKIMSSPLEDKIHIFKPPRNILYIGSKSGSVPPTPKSV